MSAGPLKDYYRILQVEPWSGTRTIKAAYRRLSRVYHPDAASDLRSTRQMQEINQAYEVLSSRVRRLRYDYARSAAAYQAVPQAPPHAPPQAPPVTRRQPPPVYSRGSLTRNFRAAIRPVLTFLVGLLNSRWIMLPAIVIFLAVLYALPPETRNAVIIAIMSLVNPAFGMH